MDHDTETTRFETSNQMKKSSTPMVSERRPRLPVEGEGNMPLVGVLPP